MLSQAALSQFGVLSQGALCQFGALSQAALCQFGALRQDTLCQLVVKSGCSVSARCLCGVWKRSE